MDKDTVNEKCLVYGPSDYHSNYLSSQNVSNTEKDNPINGVSGWCSDRKYLLGTSLFMDSTVLSCAKMTDTVHF